MNSTVIVLLAILGIIGFIGFIMLVYGITTSDKALTKNGIKTIGVINGGRWGDTNLWRYQVMFTDKLGNRTWGYSQCYTERDFDRGMDYKDGIKVPIIYTIKNCGDVETVDLRILDKSYEYVN